MSAQQLGAAISFRAIRSLVFTIGLAALSGTAGAVTIDCNDDPNSDQCFCTGEIDFCNNNTDGKPFYDNATPQASGCFTDVNHYGWRPSDTTTITFRPPEINMFQNMHSTTNPGGTNPWGDSLTKPWACGLNVYGNSLLVSNGKAEMWITIVAPPGRTVQMHSSWGLKASVWFDNVWCSPNPHGNGGWNNNKGVGIVTNYNPANKTGLFLALFDAGNTESLMLMKFDSSPDATANPRTNILNPYAGLANLVPLGKNGAVVGECTTSTPLPQTPTCGYTALVPNSINGAAGNQCYPNDATEYVVTLSISTVADATFSTGYRVDAYASVWPANSPYAAGQAANQYSCPNNPAKDQQCMVYSGGLPAGILASGAVGLATLAPTSGAGVVDTYISKFTVNPGSDQD